MRKHNFRKVTFMTVVYLHDVGITLREVTGYHDGFWYYYRDGRKWYAIHPQARVSACTFSTREACQRWVNSSVGRLEIRNAMLHRNFNAMIERYNRLVRELEVNA